MTILRFRRAPCHVALLTPYDGGNLGDAAIQEALIYNFRRFDSKIHLSGITLDPERTSERHHIPCYPLAVTSRPHYLATSRPAADTQQAQANLASKSLSKSNFLNRLRHRARSSVFLKPIKLLFRLANETRHVLKSYFFLRDVDLLVVAGGGQLDEEWGGSWGHPYALMKWTVLARLAGDKVAFLSVGGCRINALATKQFLRVALSLARYRSYRDQGSRELALGISRHADGPVVPDLAFGFPFIRQELVSGIKDKRLRVGLSPIAFARPGLWPTEHAVENERYMAELASFVASLLHRGISVTIFSSSTPDEQIFQELRDRIGFEIDNKELAQLSSRDVTTVRKLIRLLQSVDFVVASRLHGLLLSFLCGKPSIAISYDRKVKCLMEDLEQADYCLDIRSFTRDQLLNAFLDLQANAHLIPVKLDSIRQRYDQLLENQYRQVVQPLLRRSDWVPQSQSSAARQAHVCESSSDAARRR